MTNLAKLWAFHPFLLAYLLLKTSYIYSHFSVFFPSTVLMFSYSHLNWRIKLTDKRISIYTVQSTYVTLWIETIFSKVLLSDAAFYFPGYLKFALIFVWHTVLQI